MQSPCLIYENKSEAGKVELLILLVNSAQFQCIVVLRAMFCFGSCQLKARNQTFSFSSSREDVLSDVNYAIMKVRAAVFALFDLECRPSHKPMRAAEAARGIPCIW